MTASVLVLLLTAEGLASQPAARTDDGPDILIRNGSIVATAVDYEMNGTMWAAFTVLEDSNTYLYRSVDHGVSWDYRAALGPSGGMAAKIDLVVGEGDSGFVHLFFLDPANHGDLLELRLAPWNDSLCLLSVFTGPDTIRDFAACRDYTGSSYWLYAVTSNPESQGPRGLCFFRSSTYGRTWTPIMSGPSSWSDLHLAAGAGSYIYLAGRGGGYLLRGVNTLYFDPTRWYLNNSPMQDEIQDPVIGAAFTLPESTATVWCLWSQNYQNSGDWDVKYSYGVGPGGWSPPEFLAGSSACDEVSPDIRNYTSLGNPYINISYISDSNVFRTVYRRYAHAATPSQWSDTLRINQGSAATGSEVRPKLCYTPGGPFSGAGSVFVGAGLNGCWWNAPYPVDVDGEPNAGPGAAGISVEPTIGGAPFLFTADARVPVLICDLTGRVVRTLPLEQGRAIWDGTDNSGRRLAEGVYLVRLVAGDYAATGKLTLLR